MTGGPLTRLVRGLAEEPAFDPEMESCAGLSEMGQALFKQYLEVAIAGGHFELPAGTSIDDVVRSATFAPMGTLGFSIDLAQEMECVTHTERVTINTDGSYTRRLG